MKLTANLAPVWDCGDYYEKQIFQNTIFPAGLGYDSKKEHYRTTEINEVIGYVAQLLRSLEEIKKPDFSNFEEKSGLVPYGSDLSNLMNGFQALRELMNSIHSYFRL